MIWYQPSNSLPFLSWYKSTTRPSPESNSPTSSNNLRTFLSYSPSAMVEVGGLQYWLQWQVLVCAFIILLPAIISLKFIITKNNNKPVTNTYHLWMPCWRNLHPIWLLFYRLFSFISMAYLLLQIVLAFGPFVFYFYTQSVCSTYFNFNFIIILTHTPPHSLW